MADVKMTRTGRRVEFDYLRAAVVVLVVWHHAILAYATISFLNPADPIATFSPVVDSRRWVGFDVMAGFNDIFFMALMFFISGLFVWRSLARKGTSKYVSDRFIRLGIPFVIGALFLIPLAYYPAQLTIELIYGGDTGYLDFWLAMIRRGLNTAGPLWFIWLLLVFDCVAALLYGVIARTKASLPTREMGLFERPLLFFGTLLLISTVAYLPMVLIFGPERWIGIGPFVAQAGRIFFYLVYFLAGVAIGAFGIDRSMLKPGGALARRWPVWLIAGAIAYLALLVTVLSGPIHPVAPSIAFTICCAALVFSALALFLRFAVRRVRLFDNLAANAYGIYIVHYLFVTWLQFWLLGADLPAIPKAVLSFVGALLLSWGFVAALRRIPLVARII